MSNWHGSLVFGNVKQNESICHFSFAIDTTWSLDQIFKHTRARLRAVVHDFVELPAICRSISNMRVIGGSLLMTIVNRGTWPNTDVDITVPLNELERVTFLIVAALDNAGCTNIRNLVHRSNVDAHSTLEYTHFGNRYKIDILGRPLKRPLLEMDIGCLDNYYDGRAVVVKRRDHTFLSDSVCIYRPQSSKISRRVTRVLVDASWNRIQKYRFRGFQVLPNVETYDQFVNQSGHVYSWWENATRRAHTLEFVDSYARTVDYGKLPFDCLVDIVQT
jgi:hypothetical protein